MATRKPPTTAIEDNHYVIQNGARQVPWLWEGVLAHEAITLLSAPEKTGKSTLLSLLLDRRRLGGSLLGKNVATGGTVVCSEESIDIWSLRQPPLNFGPKLRFAHPYNRSRGCWRSFIDQILELKPTSFELLVIDPIMSFVPGGQSDHKGLLWALDDLRLVAEFNSAAVLLLHQGTSCRSRNRVRGPLAAYADILIDMQIPKSPQHDNRFTRRRTFTGVGRYPGVLQHVTADLNPAGTDYIVLPDPADTLALESPTFLPAALHQILHDSPAPLTRLEILSRWPAHESSPHPDALCRTLSRACELGILVRTGTGTKSNAFRYGLT